jgi:1-acyl-sn-glycerol-3-phosphate acyltransferase
MPMPPFVARLGSSILGGPAVRDRAARLHFPDAGHGYDPFGLSPDFVALGDAIAGPLYDRYFRVISSGGHNIPKTGPAVLACNHSGTLPFDGMMLWTDVIRQTDPPRCPRAIADYFVPSLPLVSTLFARCGVVGGSRGNVKALLEAGEMIMIFPEGTPGIGKRFRDRYKLQEWRQGHCEMAIRHGCPVVPVGIVGAEEQMPQLARIPINLGAIPYIPVPATLVPLPVRYHIHYGEPIQLGQEFEPDQADDPQVVKSAAQRVKAAVQALLDQGLKDRKGIFA